jgi:hypothetical protein
VADLIAYRDLFTADRVAERRYTWAARALDIAEISQEQNKTYRSRQRATADDGRRLVSGDRSAADRLADRIRDADQMVAPLRCATAISRV